MSDESLKIARINSWLSQARLELESNPSSNLHQFTHPSSMENSTYGWSLEINHVYLKPMTLEEYQLQGLIHEVLLRALENSFAIASSVEYHGKWEPWNGIQITETFRLAQLVVKKDPQLACELKIRLNELCLLAGETLESLANQNFGLLIRKPGIGW